MDYLAAYRDFLVNTKHASDNTVASYLRDIRQFYTYLDEAAMPVERVTHDDAAAYAAYLTDHGKSPATISRSIASLRSFYNYLVSLGAVAACPIQDIQVAKKEKKLP